MKIVGYGPWTLTLGSDREHELQMLQASLYARVQKLFSGKGGLVFLNRSDELFALSTGLGLEDHVEIQEALMSEFDLRLRIDIGRGSTPAEADVAARDSTSHEGRPLSSRHKIFGMLQGDGAATADADTAVADATTAGDGSIIMHMDVDGLSGRLASPYETSLLMLGLHRKMSEYFYHNYGSLAFFMGGDNFMVVSSERAVMEGARRFIDATLEQDGVQLNCGVGRAQRGREAACRATESLDAIRKMRDGEEIEDGTGSARSDAVLRAARGDLPRVYEHSSGLYL